jgi:uncharacterized membrane protein YadS
MLGPVIILLSMLRSRLNASGGGTAPSVGWRVLIPWFISGFLALVALRSLGLAPNGLLTPFMITAKWLWRLLDSASMSASSAGSVAA